MFQMKTFVAILLTLLCGCVRLAQPPLAEIRFDSGIWQTAPPDLLENPAAPGTSIPEDWLWSMKGGADPVAGWELKARNLAELAGGLKPAPAPEGRAGQVGVWRDHHRVPTLATRQIPLRDWRNVGVLEVSVFSEVATREIITLGLLSDSPDTAWKDYLTQDFTVDWQGWRTLRLRAADFRPCGKPAGWQQIEGAYFFAKFQRRTPNPYTVLHLESIRLLPGRRENVLKPVPATRAFVYKSRHGDTPPIRNHAFPETTQTQGLRSYAHQHYFLGERAIFNYFPRYTPGYPTFTPDGRSIINAGETVQWLDAAGLWQASEIRPVLIRWAKAQGWKGLYNSWGLQGAEPMVRFDQDGDAYLLEQVEELDAAGQPRDWTTRTALLLHSRDRLRSWTVYRLPGRIASFEKLDGHNRDALTRPPLILLGDYKYFAEADQASYLLIPEKRADGSLNLGEPLRYASQCIGVNYHSGDGNVVVSHGGVATIVFGWIPPRKTALQKAGLVEERLAGWGLKDYGEFVTAYSKDPKAYPGVDLANADNSFWSQAQAQELGMPAIPADHPGQRMRYKVSPGGKTHYHFSRNGVPTFAVTCNLTTRQLGEPVYLGSGGGALDDHNWPAITVDSQGYLHVLINGHHNPPVYTRSLRPGDIGAWTPPEYVMADSSAKGSADGQAALSYTTLTCDRSDTLHCVHRSTSYLYDNRLAYYRKPAGGPWSAERILVKPFKYMYNVWGQRVSYDAAGDRLFLTFFSHASQAWLTWDMFRFYAFVWPDREEGLFTFPKGPESGPAAPQRGWGGRMYRPGATELTVLVSTDHGESWRPAVTPDFQPVKPADVQVRR